MAYTTQAKIENLFGITISGGGISAITDIIAGVKAFIDRYCGKTFEAVSETRYYDGNGKSCIIIDSFVGSPTVTILNSDGTVDRVLTEGQANDYIIAPYNSTEKVQLLMTGFGWYGSFPGPLHRLKVVATFGFSATVPNDIQYIATKLAGDIYNKSLTQTGLLKSVTLGDYSASYDNINTLASSLAVFDVLDLYRDIDV